MRRELAWPGRGGLCRRDREPVEVKGAELERPCVACLEAGTPAEAPTERDGARRTSCSRSAKKTTSQLSATGASGASRPSARAKMPAAAELGKPQRLPPLESNDGCTLARSPAVCSSRLRCGSATSRTRARVLSPRQAMKLSSCKRHVSRDRSWHCTARHPAKEACSAAPAACTKSATCSKLPPPPHTAAAKAVVR